MKLLGIAVVSAVFLFISLIFPPATKASLVSIDKNGKMIVNVLSAEESIELEIPQREYLAVKDVIETDTDFDTKLSFSKKDGEIKLNVSTKSGDKSLNVTQYNENIVEIEERPHVQKIFIGVNNGKFEIKQNGVVAQTDYEINIDPAIAGLTLKTPSGLRFLSILPFQAVSSILRTKLINRLPKENVLSLIELEGKELAYEIKGDKVINLFNVAEYSIPVQAKISASTGEVLSIDEPSWLRIFGFLFT